MFLQLCDSIMDCPQHESGAGGEDEEDCDGEHFQDSVKNTLLHVFHILGSGSGDGDTF